MRNLKKSIGAWVITCMILILATAMIASAASYWSEKHFRFSALAGETVATGDVVAVSSTNGAVYKAKSDSNSLRPAVGVIGKGGASGATVEVVTEGIIKGMTAASPGARLFLSTTAGQFSPTEPTNSQVMGFVLPGAAAASTSTAYYIRTMMSGTTAGY